MLKRDSEGVWEQQMEVHSYEVDVSRRLAFDVALKYFQEAAWNHAERLGLGYGSLLARNQVWLLSRLEVVVDDFPEWGQSVTVRTWPRGWKSLLALRDFEILDTGGARLLAGTSGWLMFDLKSRRPQRLEPALANLLTFPERQSIGCDPGRLADSATGSREAEVAVKFSDLDLYDHVNNTTYVRWLLDSYPAAFRRAHTVRSMSINFLAEMNGADVALLTTEASGPLEMKHVVRRRIDGAETCRALLSWKKS